MAIDWDKIESEMGGQYKDYAPEGTYKVKCIGVEIKEVGSNGSVVEKFQFEEDDKYQYPTADHWISRKNDNFRAYHQKNLLVALGASEANAKKAVELAEAKDFDYAVKAYDTAFTNLLKKTPEVEIEVFQDGKYSRAEFTDRSVAMPHDGGNKKTEKVEDEGEEIDLTDLPF